MKHLASEKEKPLTRNSKKKKQADIPTDYPNCLG
jgi:hypothetical protein